MAEGPHGGDRSLRSRPTEDVWRAEGTNSTSLVQDADPPPRAGPSSASVGGRRDAGSWKGHSLPECPGWWLSFRVSGLSLVVLVTCGEPEIASSPLLKLSVTTNHTRRFL